MKKIIDNRVVVWGNDNANLLGVVRQLYDFKVDTFVLFNQCTARIVNKSKCCKAFYIAKDYEDGLNFLLTEFNSEKKKPFLLSTGDSFARVISNNYSELSKFYIIPGVNKTGFIATFLDKNIQTDYADSLGFKVPNSFRFIKTKDNNFDLSKTPIPCILKPTRESNGRKKDFKVKICNSKKELNDTISGLTVGNEFIIQEYLQIDNLVVVDGCRLKNGETLIHGALICEHGGVEGDSSFGTMTSELPSCINVNLIKRLVEQIDYYGPFGLDFGVSQDKSYFFEINLRIDATNYLFYKIGAPYIIIWILDTLGKNYKTYYTQSKLSRVFMDDIGELSAVSAKKLTFIQWVKEFWKADIRKYFSFSDMKPFLYQFSVFLIYPFYRRIKKDKV